jgi:protein TonB
MFDSVLLLDRDHSSRLARAELATFVVGAHVVALAALLAAQSWRIESVPFPNLPAPPVEIDIPIVFEPARPPASRPRPRREPAPPTVAQPAPAAPTPTPEQLASADVPTLSTAPIASAPSGAPGELGASDVGEGRAVGDVGEDNGTALVYETSGLSRPTILVRVDPVYPPVARYQRRNGIVVVRAEISADGHVRAAEIVQAAPTGFGFEQSALDAVRQWRFRPATNEDGRPVAVLYRLQVTFEVR